MPKSTSEVWTWFQTNTEDEIFPIASEPEFNVDIYAARTSNGLSIIVETDGDVAYEEDVWDVDDCASAVSRVCDMYLTSEAFKNIVGEDYDDEELEHQELIDDREEELDAAFDDLLSVVLDCYTPREIDDIVEDVKEHVLQYIYEKHGLSIYRPMILEDENGDEFYEEFPYECMELDDSE